MKDEPTLQQRAAGLMRIALSMLDEAGEATAAAQVQAAIDSLGQVDPAEPDEGLLAKAAALSDPTLIRAMGGALSVLGVLMARRGEIRVDELANILGIYAVTTAESARNEGLILGYWAGMLRDVAQCMDGQSGTKEKVAE